MLFGFFNALISFQKYIKKILAKKLNFFIFVYLDNILIFINKANHVDIIKYTPN